MYLLKMELSSIILFDFFLPFQSKIYTCSVSVVDELKMLDKVSHLTFITTPWLYGIIEKMQKAAPNQLYRTVCRIIGIMCNINIILCQGQSHFK